jgi:hypothetical protein
MDRFRARYRSYSTCQVVSVCLCLPHSYSLTFLTRAGGDRLPPDAGSFAAYVHYTSLTNNQALVIGDWAAKTPMRDGGNQPFFSDQPTRDRRPDRDVMMAVQVPGRSRHTAAP